MQFYQKFLWTVVIACGKFFWLGNSDKRLVLGSDVKFGKKIYKLLLQPLH